MARAAVFVTARADLIHHSEKTSVILAQAVVRQFGIQSFQSYTV